MSQDLEAAIRFGATHLRIGSDILGPRPGVAVAFDVLEGNGGDSTRSDQLARRLLDPRSPLCLVLVEQAHLERVSNIEHVTNIGKPMRSNP